MLSKRSPDFSNAVLNSGYQGRTEMAVTARKILPDVGSDDSKMKMKGDKAAERPKDDKEKSL